MRRCLHCRLTLGELIEVPGGLADAVVQQTLHRFLGIVTKSVFPALQLLSARELSSCLHCDPGDCSCSGGVRDVVQLRVEMGGRGSH